MPLNLMTFTTQPQGTIVHVNPANIAMVEPFAAGGSLITLNTGEKVKVRDDHLRIKASANARAPDGF